MRLSIILPVFNGEQFIQGSIESVLKQTFSDFELLIVDDGSIDNTVELLKKLKDKRVRILSNKVNSGVSLSLNKALAQAKGEYIARVDADDLSDKYRFQKQIDFLDNHPDYVLVGSNGLLINEKGQTIKKINCPTTDLEIRKIIFKHNPFIHSAVMFRRSTIEETGNYREEFNGAEDYDLWFRLKNVGKLANLNEELVKKRVHSQAVTSRRRWKTEILALIIRLGSVPIIRLFGLDGFVGFFTFIIYRFFLNYQLFNNRLIPPEPDDVYHYLSAAAHLPQIYSFEEYRMIFFSIWIRVLSLITAGDLEYAVKLNFYIGIIILFLAILKFTRVVENNIFHRIVLISIIALFTGTGAYHGFYWVLPSFYLFVSFILILAILLSKKVNFIYLVPLLLFFIFIHPSSLLFLFSFLFYSIISFVLNKFKMSTSQKRFLLTFLIGILFYIIYSLLGANHIQNTTYITSGDILSQFKQILEGKLIFLSWPIIYHEYFRFLILHPLIFLGFLVCIYLNFLYGNRNLLILYLSLLVLTIFAGLNPFGYRVLEFVWPVTYLIIGYGLVGIFYVLSKKNYNLALFLPVVLYALFALMMTELSLIWIGYINSNRNYDWDRLCPSIYIDKNLTFLSWDSYFAFQTYGFPVKNSNIFNMEKKINSGQLYVDADPLLNNPPKLNFLASFLVDNITRREKYPEYKVDNYYWTQLGGGYIDPKNSLLIKDCGYFNIKKLN